MRTNITQQRSQSLELQNKAVVRKLPQRNHRSPITSTFEHKDLKSSSYLQASEEKRILKVSNVTTVSYTAELISTVLKLKWSLLTSRELHGTTNHPPTINNQPKSISSAEKNGYSATPNVLHMKSIYSVMEVENEEPRSK